MRIVAALALLSVFLLGPLQAHATELGETVWLPHIDPGKDPDEIFQTNTLGIIKVGEAEDGDWRIFRGKYRDSVSRRDFFLTVGRSDLGDRESSRATKRTALLLGGAAGVIVGASVAAASLSKGGWDPPLYVGGGLIVGGLLAYWGSNVFAGPALTSAEAEALTRRYNERLRDHLQQTAEPRKHIEVMRPLQLVPWIASASVGFAVAARF